jgi:hypothetical protein
MPVRSSEARRIHSLLGQRRVSDVVMVAILSVALLAGLVGFAVRVLWIAAIVVLALGLGYVVANARQDRREGIGRTRNGPHDSPGAHSGRVLSLSPLTINP